VACDCLAGFGCASVSAELAGVRGPDSAAGVLHPQSREKTPHRNFIMLMALPHEEMTGDDGSDPGKEALQVVFGKLCPNAELSQAMANQADRQAQGQPLRPHKTREASRSRRAVNASKMPLALTHHSRVVS
jgi:hypothetical protein